MRLEFTYTPKDLQGIFRVKLRRYGIWQRRFIRLAVFIALTLILFFLLQKSPSTPAQGLAATQAAPLEISYLSLLPWVLIFLFIWFFVFRRLTTVGKKLFAARTNQLPQVLEIDEAGVRISNSLSASQTTWPAYTGWSESKTLVVLFLSPIHKFGIPKRAMNPDQLEELRQILRTHITPPTGGFPVLNVNQG